MHCNIIMTSPSSHPSHCVCCHLGRRQPRLSLQQQLPAKSNDEKTSVTLQSSSRSRRHSRLGTQKSCYLVVTVMTTLLSVSFLILLHPLGASALVLGSSRGRAFLSLSTSSRHHRHRRLLPRGSFCLHSTSNNDNAMEQKQPRIRRKRQRQPKQQLLPYGDAHLTEQHLPTSIDPTDLTATEMSRRVWFGSACMGIGTAVLGTADMESALAYDDSLASSSTGTNSNLNGRLQWQVTPINKRTGVTIYDAERAGYTIPFITYLSRFLLNFDADCQKWWYNRGLYDIAKTASADEIRTIRQQHFAMFAASVEVGLQEYTTTATDSNDKKSSKGGGGGGGGPERLLTSLIQRYCSRRNSRSGSPTGSSASSSSSGGNSNTTNVSASTLRRLERERQEARRQICLLFGLLEQNQPVEALTRQLAALDNGSIVQVKLVNAGIGSTGSSTGSNGGALNGGYAPGYGPPLVRFPPPEAAVSASSDKAAVRAKENDIGSGSSDDSDIDETYVTATGRAILSPTGQLLRVDVMNRGFGYTKAPTVTISPPAAIRFADTGSSSSTTSSTTRDDSDTSKIPALLAQAATAEATLFRSGPNKGRIERIVLTSPGAGYTEREIIRIKLAPPETPVQKGGVTATATAVLDYAVSDIIIVNNGTGYAVEKPIRVYVEPPPVTARTNMNDPLAVALWNSTRASSSSSTANDKNDRPRVVAVAYAASPNNKNVFSSFRKSDDVASAAASTAESATNIVDESFNGPVPRKTVSAAKAFGDLPPQINVVAGVSGSASSEFLSLLPAGVGLEYNALYNRYELAVDPNYQNDKTMAFWNKNPSRKIDPDFGPRGRAPIERDMQLGLSTYLRFILSGAICSSGVHLVLTPIDVVKTKVQTDPIKYPGVIRSFNTVWKEEGPTGFLQGWAPTFLGFFLWGGISYTLTEFIRRTLTESLVPEVAAGAYEVPIILCAAAVGAFLGSFILCPFESVRIRSVSQTDYAPNIVQVCLRMVREEGLSSLFAAVPVFLVKEIPFAMAKFTVFDLSTAYMYNQFPAAKEDLQLSLLVSLLGGTLGGMSAAVVSNPADVTISTLKKQKSSQGALATAQTIWQDGGPSAFFRGLPLRFIFYALLVSLQFLVYDSIRFALGIGTDDLKLYLDVLGGALSERAS